MENAKGKRGGYGNFVWCLGLMQNVKGNAHMHNIIVSLAVILLKPVM